MALQYAMSGGNFCFSFGVSRPPNIWLNSSANSGPTSAAPASGTEDTYAWTTLSGGASLFFQTPILPGVVGSAGFAGLIAGYRVYSGFTGNNQLIAFYDALGNAMCDVRVTATGLLYFTRNGTQIGVFSSAIFTLNAWNYIEFKALFSASSGTCEVRVNGAVIMTATGLNNEGSTNGGASVVFSYPTGGTNQAYLKDFYVVDTVSGANTSYLGDVRVQEVFDDGAGVNSAWQANVGPFAVTNVTGSGTSWTFTGSWTSGASNAFVGYNFNTTSCGSGNNQTGVECTASAVGSITLSFSGGSAQSGLSGSIAFQCMVQIGINKLGTRPNGDLTYIFDSTTNDMSDFVHQALASAMGVAFSGVICGIVHLSYLRKDDTGTRQVAQLCLSALASALGSTLSLGTTYQYYAQILETDPNTSTQWSESGFNAATFGVKELT